MLFESYFKVLLFMALPITLVLPFRAGDIRNKAQNLECESMMGCFEPMNTDGVSSIVLRSLEIYPIITNTLRFMLALLSLQSFLIGQVNAAGRVMQQWWDGRPTVKLLGERLKESVGL
jgi:hypothetical protein